jgi:phenylpyruvate tautomerase PptA (4-oxalocrotonate tautomerase family)
VPSLQLIAPATYDAATKRDLAERLGAIYADVMAADLELVTVAIHDLGEGGVWRCGADGAQPAALLECNVRRGRPASTRAELARQLIGACADVLGLDPDRIKVEFTQHAGDEMYHPQLGGFNREWEPPA